MSSGPSSIARLTNDAVVGASGRSVVVRKIIIRLGTGGLGWQIRLHPGIDNSVSFSDIGDIGFDSTAPGDDTAIINFGPYGVLFPIGLFIDWTSSGSGRVITVIYD